MKKIGTITFHASYNYGSNLQAYALQEFIKKIGKNEYEYNVINFRSKKQKEMYKNFRKPKNIRYLIKDIMNFRYRKDLNIKVDRFESFINNKLNVTEEYCSIEELEKANFNYDFYISGSDQLWNINTPDFEWAYYLGFVNNGKKIAYSASFGPKKINGLISEKNKISNLLNQYDYLSVREPEGRDIVYNLIGVKPDIHIDPTMLLSKEEWDNIIDNKRIVSEKYILLYTLSPSKELMHIAKTISKKLNLPIYITKYNNEKDYFNKFKKLYNTGPLEFLNLIKNAELVLTSSFHGAVFSIIFNKPFLAINGDTDFRLKELLEKTNLTSRAVNISNIEHRCKEVNNLNFKYADEIINNERAKAEKYLKSALEIK